MSDEAKGVPPFLRFKPGARVRHVDGSVGSVERVTGDRVTVQFPYRWRSSVVAAKNLTLIDTEGEPS